MKMSNERMADPRVIQSKIGDFAKRSDRNQWAEKNEELVRNLAPYPISYDVSSTQSANFSEYTYTEILGGIWVQSQSMDINVRMMQAASEVKGEDSIENLKQAMSDKYKLTAIPEKWKNVHAVCFLPGHNLLDVASVEMIARIAHEEDHVYFKPHPITNDDALNLIGKRVGWNKMIPKDVSGFELLKQCDEVYTSTASEMAISGTAYGAKVYNITNFFNEANGVYHPISRVLFRKHAKENVKSAQKALSNMISCKWSGLIFPWQDDVEERLKAFYDKSIEMKQMYRSLASPRGNVEGESKFARK
jgi:hypothetical protein